MDATLIFLLAAIALYALWAIKVVPDSKRLAVFRFGRFAGLKGPGPVFRPPFTHQQWTLIGIGAPGDLIGPDLAKFEKLELPVVFDQPLDLGTAVRVTGFKDNAAVVAQDPDPIRSVRCPNCSHEFKI